MRLTILIALAIGACAAWSAGPGAAMAQTPFRPVAVVNDSAITGFDLAQRALILNALGYPAEGADQLQRAALDQLVEDKLKLQAGEQIGITPTPELIASGIEEYAGRAGTTPEGFRSGLRARGVTDQALDDMVIAQVVWRDVIRNRFGDRIEPAEAEIDALMSQSGSGAPAAQSRSREQVRDALISQRSERLAEGLLQEMRRDALIEVR